MRLTPNAHTAHQLCIRHHISQTITVCKPLARFVPLHVVRTDERDSGGGESYADESISGSWLGVAEAAVVDTLHAVLTRTSVHRASLVHAAAEELSPMSEHVWNRTYPWPGDTPPARWLYSCCQMLRPLVGTGTDSGPEADVELLPRARALAVLLAAPTQACLAFGLSSLLKMLWSWYAKYLPVKAQADMEAHALVAAAALPRFDCDVVEDEKLKASVCDTAKSTRVVDA